MKKINKFIFVFLISFSLNSFGKSKIAIIDDYSKKDSHGHLVSKSFNDYSGKLKFSPEVIELNIGGGNLSFNDLMNMAIDLNVNVINLSFESVGLEYNYEDFKVLKKASDLGIWIVVASGNYGQELNLKKNPVYPCMYKIQNLVCVGASIGNKIWNKSNYGSWVFAYAEGTLDNMIGTSFSAPKVSQKIILFYENVLSPKFDKEYFISSFFENTFVIDFERFENQLIQEKKYSQFSYRGPF